MSIDADRRLPPPDLRERVLASVRHRPSPGRRSVRARAAALSFCALFVPLVAFASMGGVESGPRSWTLVAATAGGTFALAIAAVSAALGRGGRTLGLPRSWLVAIAVASPLFFLIWKLSWSAAYGGMMVSWPSRPGLRCFALSLAFGLWPLLGLALARRGSDPVHPQSLGAALGAACGLWAGTLVDLWCPVGYPHHVLLGHVVPILLLACIGAWIGARLLAVRAPEP